MTDGLEGVRARFAFAWPVDLAELAAVREAVVADLPGTSVEVQLADASRSRGLRPA